MTYNFIHLLWFLYSLYKWHHFTFLKYIYSTCPSAFKYVNDNAANILIPNTRNHSTPLDCPNMYAFGTRTHVHTRTHTRTLTQIPNSDHLVVWTGSQKMRIDNKERADTIIAATNARRQMNVECSVFSVQCTLNGQSTQNESHSQRNESGLKQTTFSLGVQSESNLCEYVF